MAALRQTAGQAARGGASLSGLSSTVDQVSDMIAQRSSSRRAA
jgi:hypothetical protein